MSDKNKASKPKFFNSLFSTKLLKDTLSETKKMLNELKNKEPPIVETFSEACKRQDLPTDEEELFLHLNLIYQNQFKKFITTVSLSFLVLFATLYFLDFSQTIVTIIYSLLLVSLLTYSIGPAIRCWQIQNRELCSAKDFLSNPKRWIPSRRLKK